MKFRRNRAADGSEDDGSDAAATTPAEGSAGTAPEAAGTASTHGAVVTQPPSGPWDVSDVDDEVMRLDFGALKVPAIDGMEVRVDVDDAGAVAAVAVALDDSVLQLQAFAAPRTDGLWDEVRAEMVDGIRGSGGRVSEAQGPFGTELRAQLPAEGPDGKPSGTQPVRFLGVDGPRWFLRAVVTGPGAADPAAADQVHALFRGVAVARGDEAAPPRELLTLRLPDDPALQPGPVPDA